MLDAVCDIYFAYAILHLIHEKRGTIYNKLK